MGGGIDSIREFEEGDGVWLGGKSPPPSSRQRVLNLLDILAEEGAEMSLIEIVNGWGSHISTAPLASRRRPCTL